MSIPPIVSDLPSFRYQEKMSWEITDENMGDNLQLISTIPGTFYYQGGLGDKEGGYFYFYEDEIGMFTRWPTDLDLDKIYVKVEFKLKTSGGELVVAIQEGQIQKKRLEFNHEEFNCLQLRWFVNINTELLLDQGKSFILEAYLVVKREEAEISNLQKFDIFMKDVKSIFNDEKTSDVLVIVEGKEFKCHKNILSARSEVFKNMLSHDTIESIRNEIIIEETNSEAVEDMIKFIYSGEIPDDPKKLTTELLQIADMHQLQPLLEACLKNLIESLDVPSCISTFILVDRYQQQNRDLREIVIEFIKCKATEVVEEEDCDELVCSHPALAKELLRAIASVSKEKHMCKFCLVSYN